MAATAELTELEEWRKERFEEMEFTSTESEKLATVRDEHQPGGYAADVHRVQKMLGQGCGHRRILNIFI
jgi:hypothetical protein